MTSHNALSRSMQKVPMWIVQAAIGILLTGGATWVTWASVTSWKHETRITVTETRVDGITKSLDEIKEGQKDMSKKLDRLIERRGR
jgi:hypothetical protein